MRWGCLAVLLLVLATGCESGDAGGGARPPAAHVAAPSTTATPTPPRRVHAPIAPGGMVFHGARDSRMVALTFDADMTPAMKRALKAGRIRSSFDRRIITTLDTTHTPATIFATGMWIEQYPAETATLAADPLLEFGNHSYRHSAFTTPCYGLPALPRDEETADVRRTAAILDRHVPGHTPYFRFPGGCHDAHAVRAVAAAGVTPVQWDVISGDAFGHDPRGIVRTVLRETKGGSIVVMHLNGAPTAPETHAALPDIIRGLHARGLRPVKLSELLSPH
ncbi:polysaccharide deacetylase family protein [Actinoallomurus purpureus]|uniref:polysaccharide deacetylase family protein n=1 Tax=Actinoallomurus purpureus TaxID=478114 RepID=UPI002092B3FA|nr:polysaccharide deacetylase family protein [Actinoallomurus purpureus]MCO6010634.1 polysaccharide deacetylase family protein [Actinoallomurus purpureus]